MATAPSSSSPAGPWVIMSRMALVKDQGNFSVEVAAPPLVSFATVPRSLYYAYSDKQDHAADDEKLLSITAAEQPRVPSLAAPTSVQAKHDHHDTERYPYGVAAEGEHREDFSAALAVKPRVSDLSAPFNVAKARYDDTGKLPYVDPVDEAKPTTRTWASAPTSYGVVTEDDTNKHPDVVAADDACLLLDIGLDLDRANRRILLVAHDFLPTDAAAQRDAPTATIVRVPERHLDQPGISDIRNLGIISLPGSDGAEFAVAELCLVDAAEGEIGSATLLSFCSGKESWDEMDLRCSSALRGRPKVWFSHEVIAHDGMLWWVNLEWGLLGCNLFANERELVLRHVELPASAGNRTAESPSNIEVNRMVRVSQGNLMCVEISSDPAGNIEETVVTINLLKTGPEGQSSWELQSTCGLGAIWASESYRGTRMPKEVPVLALLHPSNTDVVYFVLSQYLFSINLAQRRVVEFIQVVHQPISWRHAFAWELPPSLAHGLLHRCGAATEEEAIKSQLKEEAVQGAKSRWLHCVACQKRTCGKICGRCARLINKKLLGEAEHAMSVPGNHNLKYCLVCHELKRKHKVHEPNSIPISSYGGDLVAWASGKEPWASILFGIQSDRCWRPTMGRPYLLYRPEGVRCTVCLNLFSTERLYGSLLSFCCIKCWTRGGGAADLVQWVEEMVATDFDDGGTNAFCLTCGVGFSSQDGNGHEDHQHIDIIPDPLGRRPHVQLPQEHQLLRMWDMIIKQKDANGGNTKILIRDDRSLRCHRCRMRLLDGGGDTCSLQCALPLPPPLLPKSLLLKQCGD